MTERKNGCWGRYPFVEWYVSQYGQTIKNFSHGKECEYTKSELGQKDPGCNGCIWKKLK